MHNRQKPPNSIILKSELITAECVHATLSSHPTLWYWTHNRVWVVEDCFWVKSYILTWQSWVIVNDDGVSNPWWQGSSGTGVFVSQGRCNRIWLNYLNIVATFVNEGMGIPTNHIPGHRQLKSIPKSANLKIGICRTNRAPKHCIRAEIVEFAGCVWRGW